MCSYYSDQNAVKLPIMLEQHREGVCEGVNILGGNKEERRKLER